jgi:hypothetical protein
MSGARIESYWWMQRFEVALPPSLGRRRGRSVDLPQSRLRQDGAAGANPLRLTIRPTFTRAHAPSSPRRSTSLILLLFRPSAISISCLGKALKASHCPRCRQGEHQGLLWATLPADSVRCVSAAAPATVAIGPSGHFSVAPFARQQLQRSKSCCQAF